MSESASPSARIVSLTRSEPADVEPASHTSSALAASLSELTSILPSSRETCVNDSGLCPSVRRTVTAIASFSVEAAGKRAPAFQAAPRPVRRSCT